MYLLMKLIQMSIGVSTFNLNEKNFLQDKTKDILYTNANKQTNS